VGTGWLPGGALTFTLGFASPVISVSVSVVDADVDVSVSSDREGLRSTPIWKSCSCFQAVRLCIATYSSVASVPRFRVIANAVLT
jgi:hypothetical protein